MKKCLTILSFCFTIIVSAQESFNDIHKLVEAKKYRIAITKLREFVKTEHKHVSAHYDLAISYRYLLNELATKQNANVKNQNVAQWSDNEYQENLNFWKTGINVTDSSIYYYKQTSELMNIKFLELDLRYPELNDATKDCGMLVKVKCARTYLGQQVESLEQTNADNKSRLFNEEKKYEEFKNKNTAAVKETVPANQTTTSDNANVSFAGKYFQNMEEGTVSNIYLTGDNNNLQGYEEYTNAANKKTKTLYKNFLITGNKISFTNTKTGTTWEGYLKATLLIFTTTKKGDPSYDGEFIYEKTK